MASRYDHFWVGLWWGGGRVCVCVGGRGEGGGGGGEGGDQIYILKMNRPLIQTNKTFKKICIANCLTSLAQHLSCKTEFAQTVFLVSPSTAFKSHPSSWQVNMDLVGSARETEVPKTMHRSAAAAPSVRVRSIVLQVCLLRQRLCACKCDRPETSI